MILIPSVAVSILFAIINITTTTALVTMNHHPDFAINYLHRLKLNPNDFVGLLNKDASPTLHHLKLIQEAHLQHVPFENLSQHGCTDATASIDVSETYDKIIHRNRGGVCFEVNGLLAELLVQLGYTVCRVLAHVYVNNENFRDVASHIMLIVSIPDDHLFQRKWMMDVGFGEPSVHPLRYDDEAFDQEQVTPDGMRSKISRATDIDDDDDHDTVILYWWHTPTNNWVPRLKWSYAASQLLEHGPPLADFSHIVTTTMDHTSIFSQKLICCRLMRDQKYTVAGNKFKVTGSPRFITTTTTTSPCDGSTTETPVVIRDIASESELQSILMEHFGIPYDATAGISLTKSKTADINIWSNQ